MMYKGLNFIFIVVINFMILPHTLAPWKSPPKVPQKDLHKTCEGWIKHHKFTNNLEKNRKLAINRVRKFDVDVSYWAAIYAYFISSFLELSMYTTEPITPDKFCHKHGMTDIKYPYKTLKDVKKTCEGWIYLYGYPIGNKKLISKMAHYRDDYDDVYISIWPAIYAQFLSSNVHRDVMTPAVFCTELGKQVKPEPLTMPFMSLFGTKMSCEEWIKLSEFTDNIEENIKKAKEINVVFKEFINYWTKKYIQHVFNSVKPKRKSTSEVLPKTPKEFCESIGKPYSVKFYYNYLDDS